MEQSLKKNSPIEESQLTDESSGPRYSRIQKELVGRIADGVYPVGRLIPTEAELAQEFDTSRFTIREALRCMTEDGYVERRQGMGTRVISAKPLSGYYQSFESLQELFQIALDTYLVVLGNKTVTLDAKLAERVGGQDGEQWIRVDGIRWTEPGGRPICYIQSFIPERFEAVIPELATYQGPFFDILEGYSRETIKETQQEIRAEAMPPEIAASLGLPAESRSLQILRRYITDSGVLIASFNWHPSDQMTYRMRIRRGRQSA